MSISLNSTSKWKARNMPSFLAYIEEQKQLPKCLTMSLAAYIAFYSSDIALCFRCSTPAKPWACCQRNNKLPMLR